MRESRATLFACALLLAACTRSEPPVAAAPAAPPVAPTVSLPAETQASLLAAVTCRADSLEVVRGLAGKANSDYRSGIATAVVGDDEQVPVEILILEKPIALHGTRMRVVFGDVEGQTGLFPGAIVFGVFDGDYRPVVDALGLKANAPGGEWEGVGYTDAQAKAGRGASDEVCPPTVLLSPIEGSNRFKLGCGWCNG
jgi:hypothetical protein